MSLRADIEGILVAHVALDVDEATEKLVATFALYAKALAHPIRGEILTILEAGRRSPKEICEQLGNGAGLGTVSYHVRYLHGLDLIKLVGTKPRRGAVEHFYEAR
jgi:DNA-binding transcriptional ArsR family regulator